MRHRTLRPGVSRGIDQGQGQDALLLQVGLVQTGEAAGEHGPAPHESGFHGGVLTGGTFAVVVVTHRDPGHAGIAAVARRVGVGLGPVVDGAAALSGLARVGIHGSLEEVGRDVVEMAPVGQPWSRCRYVIGRALALGFHQDQQLDQIGLRVRRERGQQLEPGAGRVYDHLDLATVLGRGEEAGVTDLEAGGRQLLSYGHVEVHAVDLVGQRVEVQGAGQGVGDDRLRRRDEGEGAAAAVVPLREVAVVGGQDGVGLARYHVLALPLTDARTTGVGENGRADGGEIRQQAVALDCRSDPLGSGRHE